MTQIHSHRDLIVWQKSVRLSGMIAALTKRFPAEERFGLTAQILRSAASVHANIAEGHGRETRKDNLHFLAVANGSLQETDSLLAGHRLRLDHEGNRSDQRGPDCGSQQDAAGVAREIADALGFEVR